MTIYIQGDGGHAKVVRDVLNRLGYLYGESDEFAFIAIGNNASRKKEAKRLEAMGYKFPYLVHPNAYIASTVGDGTVVMAGAVIQPGCRIGKHCIINTGASIDHDCIIEDYAHIAPGAHLCGHVYVGEGALVGVGVGLAPASRVPAWHLVKARKIDVEPIPSY